MPPVTPNLAGIPEVIIKYSTDGAVAQSKEISGQDVDGLLFRAGKLATIDKLNLSVTLRGRGGVAQENLMTSIPLRFLANRADYYGGFGYAGAKAVANAIADSTNPVAALDPAVDFWADIGRYNLKGAEALDVSIASTSSFSTESIVVAIPESRPAPERPLKIGKVASGSKVSGKDLQEVWLGIPPGTTYNPYAAADGDLVITRQEGQNSRTCQVDAAFVATSCTGKYELAETKTAALLFEDLDGSRGMDVTVSLAGTTTPMASVEMYTVSRVINAEAAALDRARVVEQVATRISNIEQTNPEAAKALRASRGLPSSAAVRALSRR